LNPNFQQAGHLPPCGGHRIRLTEAWPTLRNREKGRGAHCAAAHSLIKNCASQCECPFDPEGGSSLLLVAHKIDAAKARMMTGTTRNGEVMCIG
jgi:hypothetical protein